MAPDPVETEPSIASTSGRRYSLSVGAGLDLSDTDGTVPYGQADLAFGLRGLRVRFAIAASGTASQTQGMQRVERSSATARVEAGVRAQEGDWFVRSTAGVGLAASRAVATELPDRPTYIRLHPLITGAFVGGRRLTGNWSLRAELAGTGYPIADRYLIEDVGEVGRSPRFTFSFGIGLQVDIK